MAEGFSVKTSDGKYEVICNAYGGLHVTRHGEAWRDETGNNMLYTLASDLKGEREKVAMLLAALVRVVTDAGEDSPAMWRQVDEAIAKAKAAP